MADEVIFKVGTSWKVGGELWMIDDLEATVDVMDESFVYTKDLVRVEVKVRVKYFNYQTYKWERHEWMSLERLALDFEGEVIN